LFKLKQILPNIYYLILRSYLEVVFFRLKGAREYSHYLSIGASLLQGTVLAPFLYTNDIPTHNSILLATFTDNMCIFSSNTDPTTTYDNLYKIKTWCRR
jgi:hypothetical protein